MVDIFDADAQKKWATEAADRYYQPPDKTISTMDEQVKQALLEFEGFMGGELRSRTPLASMTCLIDLGYVELDDNMCSVSTIYQLTDTGFTAYSNVVNPNEEPASFLKGL